MAKLRGLSLEWWGTIAIVGAVVVTIGVVLIVRAADPPTYFEQLAHDGGFDHNPWDCLLDVRQPDQVLMRRWPTSVETASLFCLTSKNDPFNNGSVDYVRFANPAALRDAVAKRNPGDRACVFGSRMVLDDGVPRFAALCAKRHATIVR